MTQEEKAKCYDESLKKMKSWVRGEHPECFTEAQKTAEFIFPELKESEDDRIRKAIMEFFELQDDNTTYSFIPKKDILAWLEKQGKHLENYDEAEKEKTEFVGDGFIKCHADFLDFKEGNTYWLEYIGDDKYNVRSDNLLGQTYHITPGQLYTVFKKLTWIGNGNWIGKRGGNLRFWKPNKEQFEALDYAYNSCPDTERGNYYEGVLETLIDDLHRLEKQKTVGEIVERCKNSWYNEGKIAGKFEGLTDDEKYQQAWHDAIEAAKEEEEKVDNQNCVKSVDKAEPRFHKGEWIIIMEQNKFYQIKNITESEYSLIGYDGSVITLPIQEVDKNASAFTIKDAKDGDVLVLETDEVEWVLIYKEIVTASSEIPHDLLRYYSMLSGNYYYGKGVSALVTEDYEEYLKPATKEQCDILFQKMKEAGYEWDAEKKELKKIENEPENYKQQLMSEMTDLIKDYIEQEPVKWREEDEQHINSLLKRLDGLCRNEFERTRFAISEDRDWLKSLKEKIGG